MIAFSLIIDNTPVDLFQDETIVLTRQVKDLIDLTSARTDFTQQIVIPSTKTNDAIFQNYFDENAELSGWNAFLKLDAEIYIHSIPIFNGCIELKSVKFKNGNPKQYNVIFYGDVKNALTLFGEDTLIDVDWTDYDHTINYANIKASWNQTFVAGTSNAGDIIYPVVDWEKGYIYSNTNVTLLNNIKLSNRGLAVNDFRPMIRLKAMMVNIFDKIGYTLGGTLLTQTQFDDMYVIPMGQAGPLRNPLNTDANIDITMGVTVLPISMNWTKMPLTTVVTDVLGLWSIPNDEYTSPFNGGSVTFKYTMDITALPGAAGAGIRTSISVNGFYVSSKVTTALVTITDSINLPYLSKGDVVSLEYQTTQGATVTNVVFETTEVNFGIDGNTVNLSAAMPQVKVSEFIDGFLKLFNAIIIPNGTNNFDIHNIDEWYDTGTTLDWTRYLDTTEIDHDKLEIPRAVKMSHREGKDLSNQAFLSLNNRRFGAARFSPDVDFASDDFNLESIFNIGVPSIMREVNDLGVVIDITDLQMMVMLDNDSKAVQHDLNLVFFAGKKTITSTYYFDGNLETTFPLISPFAADPTITATQSLTFGLEATFNGSIATNTLFTKYWQRYLSRLYSSNSRLVKVRAIIPVGEWLTLQMNDTVALSGNYYKIQKIEYDILKEEANLELVTYQDVDVISWSSTGNVPAWTDPISHPTKGVTVIKGVASRDIVNGRVYAGNEYITLNDQVTYGDNTLLSLKNQMAKANSRLSSYTAYESTPYTLAITGAAIPVRLSQTLGIGDDTRYTFDNANDGISDNYGGQFVLTANVSFEQVGSKDVKFYISVGGTTTLATAISYGDSTSISLDISMNVGANSLVQLMVLDLNAESHTLDIDSATLTMKLI